MQKVKKMLFYFFGFVFLISLFAGEAGAENKASTIGWKELSQLDYQTGKRSSLLEKLNGKPVRIPGYIVPLEGGDGKITEFLLVPTFGACIHVPPPPPNQIVYVRMIQGFPGDIAYDPVWVTGVLNIGNIDSPLAEASFSMQGLEVVEYKF